MDSTRKKGIHLAVIPDGNRRFGKEKEGCKLKGYDKGVSAIGNLFKWFIKDRRLETLTLYCFSEDNWQRDDEEVDYIMDIFRNFIVSKIERYESSKDIKDLFREEDFADNESENDGIKGRKPPKIIFKVCSTDFNHPKFPEDIKKTISKINEKYSDVQQERDEDSCEEEEKKTINICFSYDGQKEISQAVAKIISSSSTLFLHHRSDEEKEIPLSRITSEIEKNLLIKSYPDVILRTSGEKRLSSFLAWQSKYSEFIFLDKKWPEIENEDLNFVIEDYLKREKRYGK